LKLLDLAEIPHKSARRLAGGAIHDIDESGAKGHQPD
jgi:hypothetical protein